MSNGVTVYGKVNVYSQKMLRYWADRYNKGRDDLLSIHSVAKIYDDLRFNDRELKHEFMAFSRERAGYHESVIDESIARIKDIYKDNGIKAPVYGKSMFDHVTEKFSVFNDGYTFDVIWNWRVIWQMITIMNKCQYYTILCECARDGVLSDGKPLLSRNRLKNEFQIAYVSPMRDFLKDVTVWADEHGISAS